MLPNWSPTHIMLWLLEHNQEKPSMNFPDKDFPRNYRIIYRAVNPTRQSFLPVEKVFWYLKELSGDYLIGTTQD
jgi:hypothetical protein